MDKDTSVALTFIRHGESTDNLLPIWAGWRDAPLSEHGLAQATALGASLASTRFDLILASTLKRAYTTAELVLEAQSLPKSRIVTSPLLREQTRGIAEGHPWLTETKPGMTLDEHYAQGLFPIHRERWQKFPGGESVDDLARRAEEAVREVILPHVLERLERGTGNSHIAIASHGLFIAEMIPVLLKMDVTSADSNTTFKGMKNTAWTRVVVNFQEVEGQQSCKTLRARLSDLNRYEHLKDIAPENVVNTTDSVQTFSGDQVNYDSSSRGDSRS
ncbi:hypothetical protein PHLGIDRAFT_467808 [Phlebiopsis gigantea 11061_1 CR5-6]|uniref:Phosphoglycerate mutase-like protein n=1 Tax=Phlebiopsis gigantea (strain 11061_1 CR5-6) TaxID=745531 RepID=A0A0C3PJA2_PHLG1|nr:hypothetical protein PHLGIDRAFT_467808 [Phlebiopsis gigantea 11061_1 CR5-6]